MNALIPYRPQSVTVDLGSIASRNDASVTLGEEEHLKEHMAVYGGTGQGKSKLFELILRQLIHRGRGFCLIDPHGDLAEDLAAYMSWIRLPEAETSYGIFGPDAMFYRNVHYLEPGTDRTFALDPFHRPEGVSPDDHVWLEAKADSTARAVLRNQGQIDFRGMPRLARWLKSVLYACGVSLDADGTHLPLSDALILLDTTHGRHNEVYDIIAPKLPHRIRSNFEKLRSIKGPRKALEQEQWVESTINWLGAFLSSPVQAILSCERPSIDFHHTIQNNGVILVNLRKTTHFSRDQANAIGGMIINEVFHAVDTTQRHRRNPFYLFIDEATRFIGQDVIDGLAESRKWRLSIALGVQDLSGLSDEHVNMTNKVISQCGVQITFQQKHPDDLDTLGQLFGYPTLDFTELELPTDRPDGYDWEEVEETSLAQQTGTNWSHTTSQDKTDGWNVSRTDTKSAGWSDQQSTTESNTQGHSHNASETVYPDSSRSRERGHDTSANRTDGKTVGYAYREQESAANSRGKSGSASTGKSDQQGGSQGRTETKTKRLIPLARQREEWIPQGRLRQSVDDQFHKLKQFIRTLGKRQAVVSIHSHQTFPIEVGYVQDFFDDGSSDDPQWRKMNYAKSLQNLIAEIHPCYFVPRLSPAAEERRLNQFLDKFDDQRLESEAPPLLSDHESDDALGI